jgi:trafficking protein particle complex subunit 11
MEAYPREYVEHNLPLVFLSGLGEQAISNNVAIPQLQESGTKFSGTSPECTGDRAGILLQQFLILDGSDRPWNASSLPGPTGNLKYRMRTIGRVGMMSESSLVFQTQF